MSKLVPFKRIRGAGDDGGDAVRTPTQDPDSLFSIQRARILDLISEGEIVGLVDGGKSIFFNGVPLQNSDGSFNFTGVTWDIRLGTQSQQYMQGFPDIESEQGVQLKVTVVGGGVEQHISDSTATSVRVTVSVPRLAASDPSTGDLHGSSVEYEIDVQPYIAGTVGSVPQGFTTVIHDSIVGKTTTKYQRTYTIPLEGPGRVEWDIRVRRITPDNTDTNISNDLFFDSYTIIKDMKMTYPFSAYVGVQIDAQQFSSTPARAYDCKLLKVQVPTNYFPETRTYTRNVSTGVDMGTLQLWDGNFYVAWTDNPVWCWYDMVTQNRYGLGDYISPDEIDKWTLFTLAQYCDEMVPDGRGGMEPRFTCNLYLQSAAEAYKVLTDMASIFRGMIYWGAGALSVVQDAPTDPTYLFTNGNVIDGLFTYQGTARSARHTVALVAWNDTTQQYKQVIEYVSDEDAITKLGYRPTSVVAMGCTSQGQAHRVGRAILLAEQTETETVMFKVGIEGYVVSPGQVIKVLDNNRVGIRFGGRVLSFNSSTKKVTLDSLDALTPSTNYTFSVLLSDGTLDSKTITSASVAGNVVTVGDWFAQDPAQNSIWVIHQTTDISEAKLFRVISVTEVDKLVQEITALAYNPLKYDAIDQDLVLADSPTFISHVPSSVVVLTPTSLLLGDYIRVQGEGTVESVMTIGWTVSDRPAFFRVMYRKDGGPWIEMPRVYSNFTELHNVADGSTYDVQVFSTNIQGVECAVPAEASRVIVGKLASPADVTDFSIESNRLRWRLVDDADVRAGGGYFIRFIPGQASPSQWAQAIPVHSGVITDNPYTLPITIFGPATLFIKAVDSTGNESVNPTLIQANFDEAEIENLIATVDERVLGWPGTLTGGSIVSNDLRADSTLLMWSASGVTPMWDDNGGLPMWDAAVFEEMSYKFSFTPTEALLGARMLLAYEAVGDPVVVEYRENSSDQMWPGLDSDSMWGYTLSGAVPVYMPYLAGGAWRLNKLTDLPLLMPYLAGIDFSLMWGTAPEWKVWPGSIIAQSTVYDFRITTGSSTLQGRVPEFAIIFDVPDIEETLQDVAVAPAGTRLVLTTDFRAIKAITFGLKHDGSAVSVRWLDKDVVAGPLVQCFDAANAPTAGTVDARVVGF